MTKSVGTTNNDDWWAQYEPIADRHLREYIDYEMVATSLDDLTFYMPPLLQTERYTEAITVSPIPFSYTDESVRLLTQLRMQRQRNVFSRSDVPKMRFLIDESGLLRRIGSADIMREQLEHLLAMAKHEHISIRTLPLKNKSFFCGLPFLTSFFPDKDANLPDAVFVQTGLGMSVIKDRMSVDSFRNTIGLIRLHALSEEASVAHISQILKDLEDELASMPNKKRKMHA